jgi:sugar transferase (PEP-CTERM/EpsH1 system associated)
MASRSSEAAQEYKSLSSEIGHGSMTTKSTPRGGWEDRTAIPDDLLASSPARSLGTSQTPHSEPLRVIHVINSLGLGGTERGVLKVMEGLDSTRFEQKLCTIRGADQELAHSSVVEGKLLMAGKAKPGFQFPLFQLVSIFREHKPHIVHSRNWGAIEAVLAGRIAGVPVVIHSEHGYELDMLSGLPLRRRALRRAFYPMCDAIFTVSNQLQRYHGQQVRTAPRRIRVIPNGVDTQLFAPDGSRRQHARERFGFAPEDLVLGSIGRMVPIKGHDTMLRAGEVLLRRNNKVRLLLVGAGPELDRLRANVESSLLLKDRVVFAGASLDVAEFYQAMDIFLLASISEGLSNTLLEAMATGLPCIATDVGGNPELVSHGQEGFLFSPGDVNQLAAYVEKIGKNSALRAQFSAAARRRATSQFSLDRMMDAYTNLYSELANRRGALARN